MSIQQTKTTAWWRDPLVHFLVIGGVLFLFDSGFTSSEDQRASKRTKIKVSAEYVAELEASLTRHRGVSPSPQEIQAEVEQFIDDEIMVREARRLGLDQGDLIIRRRLIQKMRFLVDDMATATPPTDAELNAWFNTHRDQYRGVDRYDVEQVYFATERRGIASLRDATQALNASRARSPQHPVQPTGDPFLGGNRRKQRTQRQLKRRFGQAFSELVVTASRRDDPNIWYGPVKSPFGHHLLRVIDTHNAREPTLKTVRSRVRADLMESRRRQAAGQARAELRELFTIEVESTP